MGLFLVASNKLPGSKKLIQSSKTVKSFWKSLQLYQAERAAGENTKMFCGKPLIVWTIEEIKKCESVTKIIVSTDDPKARAIALTLGIDVPFIRPAEISGDLATDYEFISHALCFLKSTENYVPEVVVRLPVTSPLRRADHIEGGIRTLLNTPGADSVRPICPVSKHPYKFWKISNNTAFIEPFLEESFAGFKEPANLPRQLFPQIYQHTGAADFMWTKTILEKRSVSGSSVGYFFMNEIKREVGGTEDLQTARKQTTPTRFHQEAS